MPPTAIHGKGDERNERSYLHAQPEKRITYAEFKALPEGLQKSYVQNIIDKYRVGPSALAELMGANAGAVGVYLSKRGFSFKRGFQPTKDDLERFREDYGISANAPTKK